MAVAIHRLSILLAVIAVAMLLTALIGLGLSEPRAAQSYFVMAIFTGFVAGGVYFATRRPAQSRSTSGKYLLVFLAWLVPPLFAAVPLMGPAGSDYVAALFEAVSGLTTTGATVFDSVDGLRRTDVLWRAELHWLGGLLTLTLLVTALAPSGVGGIPTRESVMVRRAISGEGGRQWVLIRDILVGYGLLTAGVLVALAFTGMPAFDAVCLAMAAVSTGGFLPVDGGLESYANPGMEVILALGMIAGATSILWHRMLAGGRWQALRDHRESYGIIIMVIVVGTIAAGALSSEGAPFGEALRLGLVNGASLVSTSGMDVQSGGFGILPVALVLLIAVVGGGAFSTAGGIRLYRIGGMLVESLKETRRLIYPHSVRPQIFGAREFDANVMKAIWSLFASSIAVMAVAAVGVALAGVDFGGAAAAAVSAFSNVAGVYTADWAEAANWPTFAEMPAPVQLLLAGVMIVGRVEVVAIIVAASLFIWRS